MAPVITRGVRKNDANLEKDNYWFKPERVKVEIWSSFKIEKTMPLISNMKPVKFELGPERLQYIKTYCLRWKKSFLFCLIRAVKYKHQIALNFTVIGLIFTRKNRICDRDCVI